MVENGHTKHTRLTCINHAICYNYHRYLGCRLHIEFDCVEFLLSFLYSYLDDCCFAKQVTTQHFLYEIKIY